MAGPNKEVYNILISQLLFVIYIMEIVFIIIFIYLLFNFFKKKYFKERLIFFYSIIMKAKSLINKLKDKITLSNRFISFEENFLSKIVLLLALLARNIKYLFLNHT